MPRYRGRRRAYRAPFRRLLRHTRRAFPRRNAKNKYSPRRWRRHLLSDTHANTHYRSLFSAATLRNTAAAGTNNALHFDKTLALPTGATSFWLAAGGAQPVDTGNPVPGFGRNIIIRGGRISCSIALRTTPLAITETVKVTVYLIWRKPCSDNAILPASGDRPPLWDPSIEPDFTRYGRIVKKWQAILEPYSGSSSLQMFHVIKPQKIDHENFEQSGSHLEWVTCLQKLTVGGLPTAGLDVVIGHSLSFSGDEIS